MKSQRSMITLFISLFAFLNVQAADELFGPCLTCDLEGVKSAVANGADVNTPHSTSGQSALAYAFHCPEVTQYLLSSGADPNGGSYPALVSASSIASYDVMKMLLDNGADPNLSGINEAALFKIVQMTNCADCADLLLSNGADVTTKGGIYANLFGVYAAYGQSQAERKVSMNDYAATLKGYGIAVGEWYTNPSEKLNAPPAEMAKTLAKHGIDINQRTMVLSTPPNDGEPPLFTAMNVGKIEVIKSLLENGADHNATYPVINPTLTLIDPEGGYTPLMYASILGNKEVITWLLGKSDLANPSTSGWIVTESKDIIKLEGLSAIYLAIMSGDLETVSLIAATSLEWGDFTMKLTKGQKFSSTYGSKPPVYVFSSNLRSKLRYSPSLFANFSGQKEMAAFLESKGL